jgi:glycosyltransferase involved in cell wall biosynthesis
VAQGSDTTQQALEQQALEPIKLEVVIGIATTGRAGILRQTLDQLAGLADRPDAIIICIADEADFNGQDMPGLPVSIGVEMPVPLRVPLRVLTAHRGLCNQRNTILDAVSDNTVVLFLDDDFLLSEGYISTLRRTFEADPEIAMTTGTVLADGILGAGFDHEYGRKILAAPAANAQSALPTPIQNGYGCNMAVRAAVARQNGVRFDTNLPSYGWLEDVDFSRHLAAYGRIVKHPNMTGVHLGTKTGRSRGVPLGYSQIANPIYMVRKGTLSRKRAARLMLRNLAANTAKVLRPEPWVDRRGRLRGNALALRDLIIGRICPKRILDL